MKTLKQSLCCCSDWYLSRFRMKDHSAVVLVIEDESRIAELICLILEEAGYSARRIDTATRAMAAIDDGDLDLIILDWMLPDMEGVQLCQTIKSRPGGALIPVLMLTARSALADRVAGLDAGADDYLTKPFHTDELLARVRALLRIRFVELERLEALKTLDHQHNEL